MVEAMTSIIIVACGSTCMPDAAVIRCLPLTEIRAVLSGVHALRLPLIAKGYSCREAVTVLPLVRLVHWQVLRPGPAPQVQVPRRLVLKYSTPI